MLDIIQKHPEEILFVRVAPHQIDLFNKFLEAYSHLAFVTTLDPVEGTVAVWVTADTKPAVQKILSKLPVSCQICEAGAS